MTAKRNLLIGATFVTTLVALGIGQGIFGAKVDAQNRGTMVQVPRFEVDPMFPKPLPNHWYQSQTIGVTVDPQDHIWIIHRADNLSASEQAADNNQSMCCKKAPPVLEFDQQGNVLNHWGGEDGPGYQWPGSNHGIEVDRKGNVWLGGNDSGDGAILKFTKDGKFLQVVGVKQAGLGNDSNSTTRFHGVARLYQDPNSDELYIADGYFNKRAVVVDINTGKIVRFWGAYGNKPEDGPLPGRDVLNTQQFRGPTHCANISKDGVVYVCDRQNNRLQSFTKDGKFVKEMFIPLKDTTRGDGGVWDVAFSPDAQQKFMYMADGKNEKIYVMDRASMEILTTFGNGGKKPGEFYALHSIATDSKGNIYTTETYDGRRLQRFNYKGMMSIEKGKEQGTVWPKASN